MTTFGLEIALWWSWVAVIVLGWYFAGVSTSSQPISETIKQASRLQRDALPRLAQFTPPKELNYVALSRRVAGDLERAGPLYNYAKAFVWTSNVDQLVDTLQHHILGKQIAIRATIAGLAHIQEASLASTSAPTNAGTSNQAASFEASLHEIIPRFEDESSYRYYQAENSG